MRIAEDRNYSLDVIKIIATILIVFHHYQQILEVTFPNGINYFDFVGGKFYFGYMVELFFILSGYFLHKYIAIINDGLSFNAFICKRIIRFLPMIAISGIGYEIVIAIGYHFGALDYHVSIWGLVTNSLGIQEGWGIPNLGVNNPIWYVSVLLWCYILFFFVVWLAKRINTSPEKFFLFIIIIGIGIKTYALQLPFLNSQISRGYTAVFTGVLLAGLVKESYIKVSSWKTQFTSVCIVVLGVYCYFYHKIWIEDGFVYLLVFLFFPAIIIIAQSGVFRSVFKVSWLGTIGRIMFDVYVWHCTVLVLLRCLKNLDWFVFPSDQRISMYIVLVVILIIGTLSYFFIERPIDRAIKRNVSKHLDLSA